MKWTSFIAIIFIVLTPLALAAESRRDIPSPPSVRAGNFTGIATVEAVPGRHDAEIAINVAIKGVSGFTTARNPFFVRNQDLPARVLVFDSRKNYVGDLMLTTPGHESQPIGGIRIEPEMALGCQIRVKVTRETFTTTVEATNIQQIESLGPGDYFLQTAYTESFNREIDVASSRVAEGRVIGRSELTKLTLPLPPQEKWERIELPKVLLEVAGLSGEYDVGDRLALRFTAVNHSNATVDLFNPFLRGYYTNRPYAVELVDRQGKCVNPVTFYGGSIRTENKTAWVSVPPGGLVSRTENNVVPGYSETNVLKVPSGKYGLQVSVFERFVSLNPFADGASSNLDAEARHNWRKTYPGQRIASSRQYPVVIE